ncbi:MAG: hypothetical protein E6J06_12160, partial [Chloroflexi bacterium]
MGFGDLPPAHGREDARARHAHQAPIPHRGDGPSHVRQYGGSHAPGPQLDGALADPQLTHASDLISLVRRSGYRFGLGAACSTEKHPESPDLEHEFRYMQLKVESGADFLITQLFFDNRFYFDLVARARAAGIKVPIVPGLMPVPSRRSLAVMTTMSGATVPAALQAEIDGAADDDAIRSLGVRHCIAQCAELLE